MKQQGSTSYGAWTTLTARSKTALVEGKTKGGKLNTFQSDSL